MGTPVRYLGKIFCHPLELEWAEVFGNSSTGICRRWDPCQSILSFPLPQLKGQPLFLVPWQNPDGATRQAVFGDALQKSYEPAINFAWTQLNWILQSSIHQTPVLGLTCCSTAQSPAGLSVLLSPNQGGTKDNSDFEPEQLVQSCKRQQGLHILLVNKSACNQQLLFKSITAQEAEQHKNLKNLYKVHHLWSSHRDCHVCLGMQGIGMTSPYLCSGEMTIVQRKGGSRKKLPGRIFSKFSRFSTNSMGCQGEDTGEMTPPPANLSPASSHLQRWEKHCDPEVSQGWSNDSTSQRWVGEQEVGREDVLSHLRPASRLGKPVRRAAWKNPRVHLQLMHCSRTKSSACHGLPACCWYRGKRML